MYRPLGTHGDDGTRRRPDEHDPFFRKPLGKLGILAEETIPTHPIGQTNACTSGTSPYPGWTACGRKERTVNASPRTRHVQHQPVRRSCDTPRRSCPCATKRVMVNTAPPPRPQTNTTHIALGRRRRTDAIRLVSLEDVQRLRVRVAIHRHGLDPQLLGGTDHATCDFSPEDVHPTA